MKVMKSIIVGAVASLIVATGPEVAAPFVGASVSAEAAVAPPKCKTGYTATTKAKSLKNGKTMTSNRCRKTGVKAAKVCKKGTVSKNVQVKQANGSMKTVARCVKSKKATAVKCVAPKTKRLKGTVVGKDFDTGAPILAKADSCVLKKK